MKQINLYNGDCLDVLKTLSDNSIDSCVTDPPYGLSFMNRGWDYDVPKIEIWKEVFRVLKPGAHLLAFFGSRTYHRGVVIIEDAGFEIRDQLMWIYGEGFPKSHNISKAIDKAKGLKQKKIGVRKHPTLVNKDNIDRKHIHGNNIISDEWDITEPNSNEAKKWFGWGTGLKPSHEPIVMARKPLFCETIVKNVLEYGTGAINIDACKIGDKKRFNPSAGNKENGNSLNMSLVGMPSNVEGKEVIGRWPANVMHDGSNEVLEYFPNLTARFFYCPKAKKKDREEGLDTFEEKITASSEFRPNHMEKTLNGENGNPYGKWNKRKNNHPTVKPTELMKYLCRLVTPENGIVLDPFMGSGTTGKAALRENFRFVGIEMDENYFNIAKARINYENKNNLDKFFD